MRGTKVLLIYVKMREKTRDEFRLIETMECAQTQARFIQFIE